ncbi:hypothetical protein [Desulforapulum autotrophicum]|uniref:hypothetical protein n=1 Tax=Desulforapulum autotrophicum TaxID=2296 RepID=UPI00059B6184|nr:hypothetical protein [Desulforapulum autotrophicum]
MGKVHKVGKAEQKVMDKITPSDVQEVLNDMATKQTPKGGHYAPATIKQILVLIKRLFNWSIQ